jgi:hypothetical protein
MPLPDLRPVGGVDDATFEALLAAAIAAVSGDTSLIESLEKTEQLSTKATQKALRALVTTIKEAARLGMNPSQIKDDCVEQGATLRARPGSLPRSPTDAARVRLSGVAADRAEQISVAFQQGGGRICASAGGQTVMANQVVDMEWSFGGPPPHPPPLLVVHIPN